MQKEIQNLKADNHSGHLSQVRDELTKDVNAFIYEDTMQPNEIVEFTARVCSSSCSIVWLHLGFSSKDAN